MRERRAKIGLMGGETRFFSTVSDSIDGKVAWQENMHIVKF